LFAVFNTSLALAGVVPYTAGQADVAKMADGAVAPPRKVAVEDITRVGFGVASPPAPTGTTTVACVVDAATGLAAAKVLATGAP
jgi:hypothetical protein